MRVVVPLPDRLQRLVFQLLQPPYEDAGSNLLKSEREHNMDHRILYIIWAGLKRTRLLVQLSNDLHIAVRADG